MKFEGDLTTPGNRARVELEPSSSRRARGFLGQSRPGYVECGVLRGTPVRVRREEAPGGRAGGGGSAASGGTGVLKGMQAE